MALASRHREWKQRAARPRRRPPKELGHHVSSPSFFKTTQGDFWMIGETLEATGKNEGGRWFSTTDPKEKPLGEWTPTRLQSGHHHRPCERDPRERGQNLSHQRQHLLPSGGVPIGFRKSLSGNRQSPPTYFVPSPPTRTARFHQAELPLITYRLPPHQRHEIRHLVHLQKATQRPIPPPPRSAGSKLLSLADPFR